MPLNKRFPARPDLCVGGHLTGSLGLVRVALLARGRAPWLSPMELAFTGDLSA